MPSFFKSGDFHMLAWQFHGVGQPLIRANLPDPVPAEGEVVLAIKASGLCHSDVGFMDGTITSLLGHVPIVLGHEIAGVVIEVGAGVTDLVVGDRVGIPAIVQSPGTARDGGFAEKVAVAADQCVALPDAVPFEQAAPAMDAARTAYRAVVTKGHLKAGMKVGIIGFGGLGAYAVQIAKGLDANVYVAEINTDSWPAARELGASDVSDDIRSFAQHDLDVIVDFAGFGTTTASAIEAVRHGGRVVQVGLGKELATISCQLVTMKEVTLVGSSNGEKHEAVAVLAMMADGKITSNLLRITFDQIPESLQMLEHGGVRGRFVALMGDDDTPL
jgi:alcohol dehydrogenase, propanol-preferring